jgi:hypothetical protein
MTRLKVKVKVKVTLSLCLTKHHTMQTYGAAEVQFHSFLTPTLDRKGQLHALAASLPRKELRYSPHMRPSGPQSRSGRRGEKKKSCRAKNRTAVLQPVAQSLQALSDVITLLV